MEKLTKQDIKGPDKFITGVEDIWDHVYTYRKIIFTIVGVLLLGGVIAAGYDQFSTMKEGNAQESLFLAESKYNKKNEGFESARQKIEALTAQIEVDKKDAKISAKDRVQKLAEHQKGIEEAKAQVSSGDLQKDFGPEITEFNNVIDSNKGTHAAVVAGLYLSNLYMKHKKYDEAEGALNKVESFAKKGSLLYGLAQMNKGDLEEVKGACDKAVATWDKIIDDPKLKYVQAEVLLRKGLCLEKLSQTDKAIEIYKKLQSEHAQTWAGGAGRKYLRLLEVSKGMGSPKS